MNGIETIIKRIQTDAETEAQTIRDRSVVTCQNASAKYDQQAQDEYWKLVTAGKRAADIRAERLIGTAATEAKKQHLAFKQEMIAVTFEAAVAHLAGLSDDAYVKFLAGQIAKASHTGEEQLIFSPHDRERVGKKVLFAANALLSKRGGTAKLTLSADTRDMVGGVIVTDGKVDFNCGIETLVDTARSSLTRQVAEILFD